MNTTLYVTAFFVGLFFIAQMISLIRYIEKTNNDLTRFLLSIKYDDFSQSFGKEGHGKSFDELNAAFTEVMKEFRKVRAEKEEHFRFLQTVLQHIGIALLAFRKDGEVELINSAAKRLLNISHLKNIISLESFSKPLVEAFFRLKSGDRILVKIDHHNDVLQLMIYATEIILQGRDITLVSLQNIQTELEEKELEAWQNLIRVLTHEIMNSMTPITSMASTVNNLLRNAKNLEVQASEDSEKTDVLHDIQGAIQTIERRSQGLLHFVDSYRTLTNIPKPNFKIFSIAELFKIITQLLQAEITKKGIRFRTNIDPQSLELTADPELIEQVLINLIRNSLQAVDGMPEAKIDLESMMDSKGRIIITVTDNGPGIGEEVLNKIFIPFFSTKKDGSGVGLSLSRQIMRLHRGTISASSKPNEKTVFTLRF